MATAEAYDQWDDPGLAFTDEQVEQYDPKIAAAVRVNSLSALVLPLLRRSQLGEKAQWWTKAADKAIDCITWYCVVAELPGIDREAIRVLPTDPTELRRLTVDARKLGEPEEFLATWAAVVRTEMIQHVTLGRRCSTSRKLSGWGKGQRSQSNKVANALIRELAALGRVEAMLVSRTKSKVEEE